MREEDLGPTGLYTVLIGIFIFSIYQFAAMKRSGHPYRLGFNQRGGAKRIRQVAIGNCEKGYSRRVGHPLDLELFLFCMAWRDSAIE